ncbi:MAG: efflux RND transporter permease subunit, partial [Candidatus Binatia bacterium]
MQWLAEICVHRPVFATVIVLFLTVVGGFSFFTLGVDRFPKIDLPTITVSVNNTGAAPAEMENEVTDVLEGALNTVPGIDEMRSTSSRSSSNITMTFVLEKDPDQAYAEVQQKISTVLNKLPQGSDPPVARKSDPDSSPVLMYVMSAPRDVVELSDMAQTLIMDRIESADGVGDVFSYGSRLKQVKVYVNPDRLRSYNLTVTQVADAVKAQNQELPGGTLVEGSKTVGLRTLSRLTKIEDFNDIVIASRNGFPVKVSDIG